MMQLTDNGMLIAMVVKNAETSLGFYQNVLGMKPGWTEPMDEGGTKHYLTFKGGILKIFAPDKAPEYGPKDILGHTGYRVLTFIVTNILELAEHLEKNDVPVVVPIQDTGTVKWMMILDPEGNTIEFAQPA
jgi:catechol 2,3-dioxygenase-like lactoylglutathione lyase family enzyme